MRRVLWASRGRVDQFQLRHPPQMEVGVTVRPMNGKTLTSTQAWDGTGNHCHAEHVETGYSAGSAMLMGPHGTVTGAVPNSTKVRVPVRPQAA
jgi:hypothetical protein